MNKNIIRLAAIAALAVGAQAGTIQKSGVSPASWDFTPPPAGNSGAGGFNYTVDVAQITAGEIPLGSFLIGVSYVIELGTYASGNLVGTDPGYTISWFLNSGFQVAGPTGTSPVYNPPTGAGNGGFASFDAPQTPYVTTPDLETSGTLVDTANLAAYQGAGNVTFTFTGSAQSGVIGQVGAVSQFQPAVFQGARVTVTYTYSDIPEPSTYAAGAVLLAGAGFIARRRMQKA
jgi:hypothetical protein